LALTCFGFLASLLLRFWPLAIVFASPLNEDQTTSARPRCREVRPRYW
jgi:hypothetical protein